MPADVEENFKNWFCKNEQMKKIKRREALLMIL